MFVPRIVWIGASRHVVKAIESVIVGAIHEASLDNDVFETHPYWGQIVLVALIRCP